MRIVEFGDFEFAAAVDAQGGRADLHFRARVALERKAVAGGERAIALRRHPLALFTVVEPHRAAGFGDAADAAGRVGPG